MTAGLTRPRLGQLLGAYRHLTIGVVGDFFLDSYFDCDPDLDEPSLETGRTCYQVVRTRRQAGAAGTVAANLAALGVGTVEAVGFCGDDGEGFERTRAMARLGLAMDGFLCVPGRFTPTYGKPTYAARRGRGWAVVEELERLDIKNRQPTPRALQDQLLAHLERRLPAWDGALVIDQVSEAGCGVVTPRLRRFLLAAARQRPDKVMLADSRERIRRFREVIVKPNLREAAAALGRPRVRSLAAAQECARQLARRSGRLVYLTLAERGMLVSDGQWVEHAPGVRVEGPIDPVGAGDSTSAAIVASLAAGATPLEAAAVANLVGSITVQQIGTTGTAPPRRILARFDEVARGL
ncbi:MAG: PfkB family carbohydrate kinase [Gemmatimonadota bacterium]